MNLIRIITSLVPLVLMMACNPSGEAVFGKVGHYEGSLTSHLDGKTYEQVAVNADINIDQAKMIIRDAGAVTRLTLTMSKVSGNSITLLSSLGMRMSVTLHLEKDSDCYTNMPSKPSNGTQDEKITFCKTGPDLSLEIQNPKDNTDLLSLVLHHFNEGDSVPPKEQPKVFSLTEAIDHARAHSFTSRIEFEHVIQAKARARASYLHLLPQVTLGTVVNSLTPSFPGILSTIGDLAPFLLPGRWIQAGQASHQSKAEQDTALLMRLDMGVQVEGLFYSYARDSKTRDLTQDIFTRASGIRDEVKVREDLGQLPLGSTANLNSILNQIQQNLTVLDQVKAEDLASISQTLGFFGPTTVMDAIIDEELVPISGAPAVDYNTINTAALNRAIELEQMDELITAAHDAKKASYFSWLDPYGDPNLGLGFALPSQVAVIKSQIQELKIDREQLQSIVSQTAFDAVTNYDQALQAYKNATDGMAIQQSRLDAMMSNLNAGVKVDFFGLIGILQDYLGGEIAIEASRANYRVARAQIDRLLLQGYYAKF